MSTEPIDVSQWTRYHADHKHPYWWGIMGLILIEVTVIACFAVSFFYLWIVNVAENRMGWPPEGVEPGPLLYPTINLGLMFICALSMWWGGIVMEKGEHKKFAWSTVICCIAAAIALCLRWLQFSELPFSHSDHAYASFVWFLTGFHFMHVMSATLGTAIIGWFAAKGYYTSQRRLGVQVDTIYWYFVAGIWLPIYIVLYIAPKAG